MVYPGQCVLAARGQDIEIFGRGGSSRVIEPGILLRKCFKNMDKLMPLRVRLECVRVCRVLVHACVILHLKSKYTNMYILV